MSIKLQRLTLAMIDASPEVRIWIDQFPVDKRAAAVSLLLKLRFLRMDTYSVWLKSILSEVTRKSCAIYAVSKIDNSIDCLWDELGNTIGRPSHSLGSEDLVNAVLSNLLKENSQFLDHPSLADLRNLRVSDIVLIDDSVGSGQRVCDYISLMMKHKTFRSWWSFGWIRLYVVAFCRTREGEDVIRTALPGSDHSTRKYRKSTKIEFKGHYAYDRYDFERRWGKQYQTILALCDSMEVVDPFFRRGFGDTMANIVFHHSVPDNLPGLLWFNDADWRGLMPGRSMPPWLPTLLEKPPQEHGSTNLTDEIISILALLRRGIRQTDSLARAMGLDQALVQQLLSSGRLAGLITESNRLTKAGSDLVWKKGRRPKVQTFDRSLYVPQKWCVGQRNVQPFGRRETSRGFQADSIDGSPLMDGEAG